MAGSERNRKSGIIDGVDCSSMKGALLGIEKYAPFLLGSNKDALKVREWFRVNEKNRSPIFIDELGIAWVNSLYGLAITIDAHDHGGDISAWDALAIKEKNRRLGRIGKLCRDLVGELKSDLHPFGEPRIVELIELYDGLASISERSLNVSVLLNDMSDRAGVKRLYEERLTDVLEVFEKTVCIEAANIKTSDVRLGRSGYEQRVFARVIADFINSEFVIKQNPNEIIASIVALRFSGVGVSAADVKDWLRKKM